METSPWLKVTKKSPGLVQQQKTDNKGIEVERSIYIHESVLLGPGAVLDLGAYSVIGIFIINNTFVKLSAMEGQQEEAMWELTTFLRERSVQWLLCLVCGTPCATVGREFCD